MLLTTPARATHLTDACGMPVADLRLVEQHPGQTLWADEGQPIASYGIFMLGYRRGTAWIVVPKRPTRHPVALGRHVGQFLAQTVRNYALRRVDVQVSPCDEKAVRLAQWLGFVFEARLQCYGVRGETMDQYVMLPKEEGASPWPRTETI